MMTLRQNVRPYLKVFDDLGLQVVDAEVTGSNHYKITVTAHGKRRFFIVSRSESDYRSLSNFRAMVRRWKRSMASSPDK